MSIGLGAGTGTGRGGACGRSQPAASHARGTENSLQPQSRQILTSGEGVIGGWLRVRCPLRYNRISAGTLVKTSDLQLGQDTVTSLSLHGGWSPVEKPNLTRKMNNLQLNM